MEEIKDVIARVIGKMSRQPAGAYDRIQEIWEKTVDANAVKHTRVIGIKNDQMLVHVDSSSWLYQMNIEKERSLNALKQELPQIKSILFKIGKVKG